MMLRLVATTLLLTALTARAEKPNPYLAQAKVFYQGFDFKKCLERIKQAERWESSVKEQAELALYSGLCLFYVKKVKEAEVEFERALTLDRSLELPPLTSPKIRPLWDGAQARVGPAPKAAPAPAPEPEPVATNPTPVDTPTRDEPPPATKLTPAPSPADEPPAEVVASPKGPPVAPFVVGGVAVAAGIVGGCFGALAGSANAQAAESRVQLDALEARQRAESYAIGANVAYGVAGAAAVTALILFIVQK